MNKKFIVRMMVGALMMGSSAVSMAAANNVGGSQATISGSVVSPTCTVTSWPTDIQFNPVNVAEYATLSHNSVIQEVSQGQFELANCPANTAMKFTVSVPQTAQGNIFQALVQDASGREVRGLALSFVAAQGSSNYWYLDGSERGLGTTNGQGSLSVPAYAVLLKRGGEPAPTVNGVAYSGNFSTTLQYTVSYD
ncbi:TPA: type 1 fimbrial protein [Escherichia coli]|uniref:fimbrial protein n=1 Tax=Escherichia coli TaxID=562 RepID=UPI002151B496|nr:hypothetical protein [Escherichia coli]EIY8589846.1 type 1 fimbrial protein [Escherichia coli]EKJ6385577.1 type 1 fimbrial protein [Escherichia coli]MCR6275214.1 hypothetical protein [Escherichia coli]MCV5455548.1 hypothetical protein [Escherichia coli]HAX7281174.1 type 1 fimbrial protein [Escherichia coli]